MRKEPKKAHLNLSINPYLAEVFESLEPVHGKSFSGFLEEKITELLKDIAPDKILELEIEMMESKLSEMKENLPALRYASKMIKESKKRENIDTSADDKREILFVKYLPALEYQVKNRRCHDWAKLQDEFGFKTRIETEEYINSKLFSHGIKA